MVRVWLVVLAGCYSPTFVTGSPCPDGICPSPLVCSPLTKTCEETAQFDALPDAPPDAIEGCYGTSFVAVCPDNNITGNDQVLIQTITTLNTTTSNLCEPYHLVDGTTGDAFCLIAARTITVSSVGRWNITGTRPLVLLATTGMSIDGTIDVASQRAGRVGPSSHPPECVAGGTPTLDDGGWGGSFGTSGGDGGGTALGAPVMAPPADTTFDTLRGGCNGRAGNGGNAGAAGRGGGALYLIANTTMSIGGTLNASGASGIGAGLSSGGGGGGSGGMIVLHAPSITVLPTGRIFANGGGGGEGGGGSNGGNDGIDSVTPTDVGDGGAGNAGGGGDGGNGAFAATAAQPGLSANDSGGGGGGGAGVIRVFPSQSLGGSISPQPR